MPHFSLFCVLASTALVGCLVHGEHFGDPPALPPGDAANVLQANVLVTRVVDGDTIEVEFPDERAERIRFQGIDTPEMNSRDPGLGPEPWAEAATDFVRDNIGTRVSLEFDSHCPQPPDTQCRDSTRSKRLLAYVRTSGGLDLGAELLESGLALVYIYADQPFDREGEYSALERQAMAAGVGVWSD